MQNFFFAEYKLYKKAIRASQWGGGGGGGGGGGVVAPTAPLPDPPL